MRYLWDNVVAMMVTGTYKVKENKVVLIPYLNVLQTWVQLANYTCILIYWVISWKSQLTPVPSTKF